jgi:DNA-binding NtrC family response regulator
MTEQARSEILRHRQNRGDRIECVYLTCFRPEFSSLATVLQYSGIHMLHADSLDEADFILTVTGAGVFLCDVTFPDGAWRDALYMAAQTHRHTASLIVAEPVDKPFLSDAFARGACAVLWKPFDFMQAIDRIRTLDQAAHDRTTWLALTKSPAASKSPQSSLGLPSTV